MNSSYPDSDRVLKDLGASFIGSFIGAIDGARDDFRDLRAWRPEWSASFTGRFTANFLHERIWARLVARVDGAVGIHVVDREPIREIRQGTQYMLRVKRHHPGDRISAYPTEGSSAFWTNSVLTLDGLESYSLALGYLWDADLRAVGQAVLSFRDGRDNPIWAVELRRDATAASGFASVPLDPTLPELDLSRVAREEDAESGAS